MRSFRYSKPEVFPDLSTRHWVIEASAGTGKTHTIESLVVELVLEADLPLEKIVIVTYTEPASLELRRRIREMLQRLLELAQDELTSAPTEWKIDDKAREKLAMALQSFDRTVISTIHAFCQKILQDGTFEAGKLFRQQRVDDSDLFREAFSNHLRTDYCATKSDTDFLSQAIAWAGSPDELFKIVQEAYKARAELVPSLEALDLAREAYQDFPFADLDQETILTATYGGRSFTAAKSRFLSLKETILALRADESLEGWSQLVEHELFTNIQGLVWGRAVWTDPFEDGPAMRIRAGLQAIKDTRPTLESVIVHRLLPPLKVAIEARKASEGLYDFNDMIDQVTDGLKNPDMVTRQKKRYEAALVDECQDTDSRQWEIFKTLFADDDHRLFLVGDPKQAIYDFRGGDLPTYLRARDFLLHKAGGSSLPLAKSYRSSPGLVQAVNQLLEPDGLFFSAPNEYPHPVTAARPTSLSVQGIELPPLKLLKVPTDGSIAQIRNRIATGIASTFRNLLDSSPLFDPADGKNPPRPLHAGDFMVLTYSKHEMQLMAEALAEAGLPSVFFKADGLFQSREAYELKDLLGAILRPDNRDARVRALLTRFFGFGIPEAEACLELAPDDQVLTRLEHWHDLAHDRRYPRLFNAIMEESCIVQRLLLTEPGDRALTNFKHIIEQLLAEVTASHPDLEALILHLDRWILKEDLPSESEEAGTQRAEGESKAVRLLTIFKAKGLDAPVVAVFGGYGLRQRQTGEGLRFHNDKGERCLFLGKQGAMPMDISQRSLAESRQEEQRKLYVAITRPKVQLVLPVFQVGATNPPDPRGAFDNEGHPKGHYGLLNRRLRTLMASQPEPWDTWAVPLPGHIRTQAGAPSPVWPTQILLPPNPPTPDFAALARVGRPLGTYSFTSLSRIFGESSRGGNPEDTLRADEVETRKPHKPSSGLPGGIATGSALHKLLEQIPKGQISVLGEDPWKAEYLPLAEKCLSREGVDLTLASSAMDLAHLALTTPIELPDGTPVMLDTVTKRISEVDFQMPFPDHPDSLEGSIDLLFEVGGRIYVLDWKSNTLDDDDYGPSAVEEAVMSHYDLQVRIYTLAALTLYGIFDEDTFNARFGGAVYVFLRGLPEGGIWKRRPSWAEVVSWREELSALGMEKLALSRMEWGMNG